MVHAYTGIAYNGIEPTDTSQSIWPARVSGALNLLEHSLPSPVSGPQPALLDEPDFDQPRVARGVHRR